MKKINFEKMSEAEKDEAVSVLENILFAPKGMHVPTLVAIQAARFERVEVSK